MMNPPDPTEEIRQIKRQLAAQFDNDLLRMVAETRRRQHESGRHRRDASATGHRGRAHAEPALATEPWIGSVPMASRGGRHPMTPVVRHMMNLNTVPAALVVVLLVPTALRAQMALGERVTLAFASVAEGKRLLTSRDDFVERMSPFDRAARLKTDQDVSERQYLEFVGQNVLEWNEAEKQTINSALQGVQQALIALALPVPETVLFVKTTGKEEGGAAYTRANAIVFPQARLQGPAAGIQQTICHELFHIVSRANADLREKLYAAIGFAKCHEEAFPRELQARKITNPDAPRNDHCIRVQVAGKEQWAIPILFSTTEKYDVDRGGEFFDYLQFRLLLVERSNAEPLVRPLVDGHQPQLVSAREVSGFFEQVGKNTGYIIHPEEILADNFALLVSGRLNLPSPEVIGKIQAILNEKTTAEPGAATDAGRPRRPGPVAREEVRTPPQGP